MPPTLSTVMICGRPSDRVPVLSRISVRMRAIVSSERDPYLRERVPRDRVLTIWGGPSETPLLAAELAAFSDRLAALPAYAKLRPLTADEASETYETWKAAQ